MADTVSVTQSDREAAALLFDRISWQGWNSAKDPHSGAATHMLEGRGDGSPFVQAFARHRLASTQPAPAFPREEVAKIIDPAAWEQRNRHLTKAGEAEYADHAHQWFTRADDVVAASLRTADAIALVLQGKQP